MSFLDTAKDLSWKTGLTLGDTYSTLGEALLCAYISEEGRNGKLVHKLRVGNVLNMTNICFVEPCNDPITRTPEHIAAFAQLHWSQPKVLQVSPALVILCVKFKASFFTVVPKVESWYEANT